MLGWQSGKSLVSVCQSAVEAQSRSAVIVNAKGEQNLAHFKVWGQTLVQPRSSSSLGLTAFALEPLTLEAA